MFNNILEWEEMSLWITSHLVEFKEKMDLNEKRLIIIRKKFFKKIMNNIVII